MFSFTTFQALWRTIAIASVALHGVLVVQAFQLLFFEFTWCLPHLAGELAAHLRFAGQGPVPPDLDRIASEVANGKREVRGTSRTRPAKREEATDAGGGVDWPELAQPEELGEWNANGQRSWLVCESTPTTSGSTSDDATGWFVICHGGVLQTHKGDGRWVLHPALLHGDPPRLAVEWGGCRWELQLQHVWQGQHRLNFVSSPARGPEGDVHVEVTGWVSRGKSYRYKAGS